MRETRVTEGGVMGEAVRYTIGSAVRCTDGACGSVKRVVMNPVERRVTHLVVDPGSGQDRLVPVSMLDCRADEDGITLACGHGAFEELEDAEEEEPLPGADGGPGQDPAQTVVWPVPGPSAALGCMSLSPLTPLSGFLTTTRERVPAGGVQIRRGEHAVASDGDAGRVRGLVVDEEDQTVTHVLLSEGHLWGRKTVEVPFADVAQVGQPIRVNYTKDQLKEFPGIDPAAVAG
jgi:sporulation protein YlmC with PRC-barrel domain